jgi:hypothetical protein
LQTPLSTLTGNAAPYRLLSRPFGRKPPAGVCWQDLFAGGLLRDARGQPRLAAIGLF